MNAVCLHPHKDRHSQWLLNEPLTPAEPTTLAVRTDAGWVWFHGVAECDRGRSAQYNVGQRAVEAGIAIEYRIEQHDRGHDYGLPQALLSYSLAVAEERFCVAASLGRRWGFPIQQVTVRDRNQHDIDGSSALQ